MRTRHSTNIRPGAARVFRFLGTNRPAFELALHPEAGLAGFLFCIFVFLGTSLRDSFDPPPRPALEPLLQPEAGLAGFLFCIFVFLGTSLRDSFDPPPRPAFAPHLQPVYVCFATFVFFIIPLSGGRSRASRQRPPKVF